MELNSRDYPFVQFDAIEQYEKAAEGDVKQYPSLELVRLEKIFFEKKGRKLLEYAFGSGCNTIHLLKCGYEVHGIDVSSNWLKKTKERIKKLEYIKNQPNLFLLDPEKTELPFEESSFDYLVAMSVLSLLGSEKKVKNLFKEFKGILKQSGKIIVDINDHQSEFSKNKKEIKKNVFLSKPVDKEIACYCLKNEMEFKKLVEFFFSIKDVGFSSHKVFGRTITKLNPSGFRRRGGFHQSFSNRRQGKTKADCQRF